MKTLSEIRTKKGHNYTTGLRIAKRNELNEKNISKVRDVIRNEIRDMANANFIGNEYDTTKLERYVGIMDGFNLAEFDIVY